MKIGLILLDIPGISETFIINKIKGLVNSGFEPYLFISRPKNNVKIKSIHVPIFFQVNSNRFFQSLFVLFFSILFHPIVSIRLLILDIKSSRSLFEAMKNLILSSHIIGKPIDSIHYCFTTSILGKENVAMAMGIKSSISLRGYDISIYPYQNPGCYDLLWNKIDKVHSISDDLYAIAIQLGLSENIPYMKIPPSIDVEKFKPNLSYKLSYPVKILTVGRLVWKKGYEHALQALVILRKKGINFRYCIIGEGPEREKLKFLIDEFNLNNYVNLEGALSPKEVIHRMMLSHIYIQPSIQEGFCNAVLEAQSIGLLSIVSDAEGLPENVLDEITGWVIPKRKPSLLAEKIEYVLNIPPEEISLIRNNAISRVEKDFNLEKQDEKFAQFFNNPSDKSKS